ncbi:20001_t:CDS:1, partial [Racocetra fulgida]
ITKYLYEILSIGFTEKERFCNKNKKLYQKLETLQKGINKQKIENLIEKRRKLIKNILRTF